MRLKHVVFLVLVVLVSSSALAQNQLLMTGLNNRGDNISIFEFRDTSFKLVWSWNAGSGVYFPRGRLGDVNNDGIADVALTRFVSAPATRKTPALKQTFVDILQAAGLQANGERQWHVVASSLVTTDGLAYIGGVGDFDGDGLNEILISKPNPYRYEVWGATTANSGALVREATVALAGATTWIASAGDLNSNGVPELLLNSYIEGAIDIWEFDQGVGDYVNIAHVASPGPIDDGDFGDVDGDGMLEWVFCGGFRKSMVMKYSSTHATYDIAWSSSDAETVVQTCSVGDFDGNGVADFADVPTQGYRAFGLLDQFSELMVPMAGQKAVTIGSSAAGDVNGDGRYEFIYGARFEVVAATTGKGKPALAQQEHRFMLFESDLAGGFKNTARWTTLPAASTIGPTFVIGKLDPFK